MEEREVIKVLELLKEACRDIQSNPAPAADASIKALLELEHESHTILSDPALSHLSHLLSYLKTLFHNTTAGGGGGLGSFVRRRLTFHQIARVAASIERELQAWIDRVLVESLAAEAEAEKDDLSGLLSRLQDRVSEGFNRQLQDLVLKSGVFSHLESILTNPAHSIALRHQAALAIDSLIRFNKNVFVGQVLMGPTANALISIASAPSLQVLSSLIKSIKSPLVDEIESEDHIGAIIGYMYGSTGDAHTQVTALECVMEIGYYGRKEAVEAMIKARVVEKLMEMQRSSTSDEEDEDETHPFASCVARFAVQLEVGEGLRQREKRALKQEILRRVKDASLSDAEAATIQAQVLWGSFL